MTSSWDKASIKEIYHNGEKYDRFTIIYGWFRGQKHLGLCWDSGYSANAPLVVDDVTRNAILTGLLNDALQQKARITEAQTALDQSIHNLTEAIRFFNESEA